MSNLLSIRRRLWRTFKATKHIRGDVYSALRAWAMFDEANGKGFNPELRERLRSSLKDTKEAHAYNYLLNAFVNDTLLSINRLLEPPKQDRACFGLIVQHWQRDDFKMAILEFSDRDSKSREYGKRNRDKFLWDQLNAFEELSLQYNRFKKSGSMEAMRRTRNHFLAHRLVDEPPVIAKYSAILDGLSQVKEMYRLTELAVHCTTVSPEDMYEQQARIAERFWNAFELGMTEVQRLKAVDTFNGYLNRSRFNGLAHF